MHRAVLLIGLMTVLLVSNTSEATVYTWRDDKGALHFANDADDVPSDQNGGVRSFTAKAPPRTAASASDDGTRSDRPSTAGPPAEYERGLAAGLQIGTEQLRAAVDMAQTVRESAPPAPI